MEVVSYPGNTVERTTHVPRRPRSEVVGFGAFELRTDTGEFWKHGIRRRLQQKSLQILELLSAKPGELVTRDELRQKLWSDGTFVDFESGLNTAINRLRAALGDSAEAPQFIETLPRLGYRFICPVTRTFVDVETDTLSASEPQAELKHTKRSDDRGGIVAPRFYRAVLLSAAATVILILLSLHSRQPTGVAHPSFRQLTFQTGNVASARFVPSSEKIAYTAKWQDGVRRTYLLDLRDLSSRALNVSSGILTSISSEGDYGMISRDPARYTTVGFSSFSHRDGKPSVVSDATLTADWLPESHNAAIVRLQDTESVVEFPSGHVVYSSRGWITNLRVSPRGDQVAFFEHPVRDDDGGYLRVVDKKGKASAWTPFWSSAAGLAWSQSGHEVWFTASKEGGDRALYAASAPGKLRLISQGPSSLRILDISKQGQVLVALDDIRMNLMVALPGKATESDLSKFDCSHADDISPDGRFILFTEGSSVAGKHYTSYLHDVSSHVTIRLAQGRGLALSPDARWAITIDPEDRRTLVLHAREGGEARRIHGDGFEYQWAKFLPNARELLVGGSYPGEPLMICKQALTGGKPKPVESASYMDYVAVSADGTEIAGLFNGQVAIFHLLSKNVRKMSAAMNAVPVAWSEDGRSVYVARMDGLTIEFLKYVIDTEQVEHWKTIPISKTSSFAGLASIVAAPQAGSYAYSEHLKLSRLYIVDGWH